MRCGELTRPTSDGAPTHLSNTNSMTFSASSSVKTPALTGGRSTEWLTSQRRKRPKLAVLVKPQYPASYATTSFRMSRNAAVRGLSKLNSLANLRQQAAQQIQVGET